MMAGGASLAPRRWALVALEMLAFSSPLWRYTAMRVLTTKVMKRRLSSGFLPGAWSRMPVTGPESAWLAKQIRKFLRKRSISDAFFEKSANIS